MYSGNVLRSTYMHIMSSVRSGVHQLQKQQGRAAAAAQLHNSTHSSNIFSLPSFLSTLTQTQDEDVLNSIYALCAPGSHPAVSTVH